jgi:hypothetical protein
MSDEYYCESRMFLFWRPVKSPNSVCLQQEIVTQSASIRRSILSGGMNDAVSHLQKASSNVPDVEA